MTEPVVFRRPKEAYARLDFVLCAPEQIVNPRMVRSFRHKSRPRFEWQAHYEPHDGAPAQEVRGFSSSVMSTPEKWWPVDMAPYRGFISKSELTELAIMEARSKARATGLDPNNISPLQALIILLEHAHDDPTNLAAAWFENAVAATEISRFLAQWKNSDD